MAKFRKLALFFAAVLVSTVSFAAGSILSVEGGVYSRVTARIDADAVPRPHCRRAIKNIQVSSSAASIVRPLIRYFATLLYPDHKVQNNGRHCYPYEISLDVNGPKKPLHV